uniref:transposase n=1 Tax=Rhizobium lentis TaxID=1138194 RepID=UPI0035C8E02F
MRCCSAPSPRRCASLPPTQEIWVQTSAFIAVLHSWGQTLHYHPRIHCIVLAAGCHSTSPVRLPAGQISSSPNCASIPTLKSVVFCAVQLSELVAPIIDDSSAMSNGPRRRAGRVQQHGRGYKLDRSATNQLHKDGIKMFLAKKPSG